jgi:peptidoglycan/LPS O-acetylase OafA/YrhL
VQGEEQVSTQTVALGSDLEISRQSTFYIPTLNGWRAVAVSLVIGSHASTLLANNGSWLAMKIRALFTHGGFGVDIFFALSGYLICTLLLREKERNGTISLSRFYVRRLFRIMPPLLLYLFCVSLLSIYTVLPHIDRSEFAAVLLFYRNYMYGTWYTGHFWSLAVEEHFYLFAPVFILAFRRKWAVRSTLVLIGVCICIRALEFAHRPGTGFVLEYRTENRYDGLLLGCFLALVMQHPTSRDWLRTYLNTRVFLGTLVGASIVLTGFTSQPVRRTVVALVLPILIGYTVLNSKSIMGRFLEHSVLKWLGSISYSLYLWQTLFLPQAGRPLGVLQEFPFAFIVLLLCATLSFYLVESPMIKIGRRLTRVTNPIQRLRIVS